MALKDRTKTLLADTLRTMMEHQKLANIRLGELCEKAGVSRSTFYYHFQDKYDLLAWMIDKIFLSQDPDYAFVNPQSRTRLYETVKDNARFFKSVYSDPGISELVDHLVTYDVAFYEQFAKEALGTNELTEYQVFSLRVFVYGGIYTSREWVLNGFTIDPAVMSEMLSACMPPWLSELVSNIPQSSKAQESN